MNRLTRVGILMYNLCYRWTKFIIRHKKLYYTLSCTWGIFLTFVGILCTGVLYMCGSKCEPYYWIYFQQIKKNWGGFELGLMFVRDTTSTDLINAHEFGHTFQNCLFGPLMTFVVSIPSCTRYWYLKCREKLGNPVQYNYDDIWFEKSATDCGRYAITYLQNKNTEGLLQ